MLEMRDLEIDGIKFQLNPIPILKAARLDKKVITVLGPILGTVKGLDEEINLEKVVDSVLEALSALSDSEYENFIVDLCSTVVCILPGEGAVQLDRVSIDKAFKGNLKALYKLMFEVMKYNKFTPFGLVAGGNVSQVMSMLNEQSGNVIKSGRKLEKSEN